jgi:hypothetical protein
MVNAEIAKQQASTDGENRWILSEMAEGIRGIEDINVCVCSFSEAGDSLSQWRAYGGPTSGYAIGFNPAFLADLVRREGWCYLAPCLYEQADQEVLIQDLVSAVYSENVKLKNDGKYPSVPRGGYLAANLHKCAPILKHHSFKEEKEWRVIMRPLSCSLPRYEFRPGNSMITPYYRIPLGGEDGQIKLGLDEVMIGPTPHIEHSRAAVKSFLVGQGLADVPVNKSEVPYRNW